MEDRFEPAVRFENVNYSIDGDLILKEVTGSFPKGRITTIVGPSGAGKSTLLKLCNGLISPDSGKILIDGRQTEEMDPVRLRRKVGIALQDAPMMDGSVFDNLEIPLVLQGKRLEPEAAQSALTDVGLPAGLLSRDSRELSGGQRQKVSIARTLINRPEVLLLDEITSSLDPASQAEIELLIKTLNDRHGTTVIWITHNIDQAVRIGDYTWVMMDGKVAETGEALLLHEPATLQVREFVKGGQV
ncbi:phosphate ABC transporter ATP-binding protein [Indiicoccus explosivorum]|uniref:ABC transporter ATP-binding protein n=1 Tax=Indiicoccus explosivorum TaxID=1917864 RepID=UPI000B44878B|nr:phosphate ABC transporter ATP-binding protein [Indiicoccus explosivorum]